MRRRRSQLRERRHKDAVPTVALVGYTNAGKTTLFNRLTDSDAAASERAVRDARPAGPPRAAAGPPRAADVGHGRVHRSAAARARGGVSRDARRNRRSRSRPARDRRLGLRARAPHARRCHACSKKWARPNVPRIEVFNKIDQLSADERRRLGDADPSAVLISAATGEGCDELRRHGRRAAVARPAARVARVRPRRRTAIASAWPGSIATARCIVR